MIVYPPRWDFCKQNKIDYWVLTDFLRETAAETGSLFLNYAGDSLFSDPGLYFDAHHLNAEGAKLFTSLIARKIIQEK